MEGLIPFVYRAIMQQRNSTGQSLLRSALNDSPSASYSRLPTGESGRFQATNFHVLRQDHGFSTSSSPSSAAHRRSGTSTSFIINSLDTSVKLSTLTEVDHSFPRMPARLETQLISSSRENKCTPNRLNIHL
ncbi:hypothetical protein LXL04_036203 [Taraxacum kok-saghyz]